MRPTVTRTCVRDHPLTGDNLEVRRDGKVVCRACHQSWALLARRVARIEEVIDRHAGQCEPCQAGDWCPTRQWLYGRLRERQMALEAWRARGRQNGTHAPT
jgi:RecB family exonuclease